jgi:hypothetical protein
MEGFRFTKYTNECCEVLKEASEFPTDAYLVQLIRVMHLGTKVRHTTTLDELGSEDLSAPLGLLVRGHQAELQQLKTSFSCEFPHSGQFKDLPQFRFLFLMFWSLSQSPFVIALRDSRNHHI